MKTDDNTDDTNTNNDGAPESGAGRKPAPRKPPAMAPARTSLEEFTELLKGFSGGGDDDAAQGDESHADVDGEQPPARKPKKPKTFADLAAAASVDVDSLYSIEVPSSRAGEKPYTLGQLKDLMKERDDFALASLKLEEDRRAHDRDKVNAEQELNEMLEAVPADQLKPESVKKIRDKLEAKRAKARAEILEAIPEWQEPIARESELKAITEHLKGYGIPHTFVLANLDPKVMRFIRDSWRRAEMVRKALEAVEVRRGKTPGRSRKGGEPRKGEESRRAPTGRLEGEVAGFRETLNAAAGRKKGAH
jgi:hypothetical protein